ncbi:OmpA/MotB family protein [Arenicella xantha]|uniref:Flagellar motor protein MotB n=1 Tax=Arenicella xantha TaxID=644221 RepID=A0A395JMU2_9GAMM|nr:OmpA family protein [Arenicella xantha]RBP52984.1 flagellar motor protein MotB [Arenicella xantha]
MAVRTYRKSTENEEENPYWVSFSDIMAGLLVLFILAALALILELMATKIRVSQSLQELVKAESVRADILREVREELAKANIVVEIGDNDTVLRIPESTLTFKTNRFEIPDNVELRNRVRAIGSVLSQAIRKENRWGYLDTIFVEGHTDIRPSNRNMGNWGLSTFRAASVWLFWEESLDNNSKLSSLMNHSNAPLFSVSGYGETRPTQKIQQTNEQLRQNRRIDLRITVKRPKSEDIRNILNEFSKG